MEDRRLMEILNNPQLLQRRVNESRDRIPPLINAMVGRAKAEAEAAPRLPGHRRDFRPDHAGGRDGQHQRRRSDALPRYLTIFVGGFRTDRGRLTPWLSTHSASIRPTP
jgi:hypothetical protein